MAPQREKGGGRLRGELVTTSGMGAVTTTFSFTVDIQ